MSMNGSSENPNQWWTVEDENEDRADLALRLVILRQEPGIRRFPELEKGLHVLLDRLPAAFVAQIDVIFIDHHHAHPFPFLPAGQAYLGFHLGLEASKKNGIGNRLTLLSARHALHLRHETLHDVKVARLAHALC